MTLLRRRRSIAKILEKVLIEKSIEGYHVRHANDTASVNVYVDVAETGALALELALTMCRVACKCK